MEKSVKRPATEAIAEGYYRFNLPEAPNPQEVDHFVSLFKTALRKHAESEASIGTVARQSVMQWLSGATVDH